MLLLSATFFRSHYAKLFYMIRMLRSTLPRTEAFLTALLSEHVVCYVPASRRRWALRRVGVELPADLAAAYTTVEARVQVWTSFAESFTSTFVLRSV